MADWIELKGIEGLVGDHAQNLTVSSTKSMTGHLLGAAGAIEAAFCVLAIRDQIAPPTINLDDPEMETPIDLSPGRFAYPAKQDKVEYLMHEIPGQFGNPLAIYPVSLPIGVQRYFSTKAAVRFLCRSHWWTTQGIPASLCSSPSASSFRLSRGK